MVFLGPSAGALYSNLLFGAIVSAACEIAGVGRMSVQ